MKLAIVGGRDFDDWEKFCMNLEDIEGVDLVISGECPTGSDRFAKAWAEMKGIEYVGFIANWDKHGKAAGPIRTEVVVKACDRIVLYWDGRSPGTKSALDFAKKHRKRYRIVSY